VSEPQVAYYYEMTSKTLVRVVRTEGRIARLDDGSTAMLKDLYRPEWLARAEQALLDARDEAETTDDVRYGGAM
jgi:hypothetical protein